ncbi:MAG: hypothetical protein AMJ54_00400 [Deltaproteobacteria bacterium SG8_13]|nr:MAG: hypothetical protein AMJ54_00400 [Deltaproteobacteria bacterium SG8_13]
MLPDTERRKSVRAVCSGRIRFSRVDREMTITADLTDFSEEGLGFLSASELKPGSTLMVQVEQIDSAESERPARRLVRSQGIVEVRWCRPVGDRWNTVFATGVKYLLI